MSFQGLGTLDGTERISLYKQIGGNKFVTSQQIASLATGNTSVLIDNLDGTYTHDDGTGNTNIINTNADSNPFNNSIYGILTGGTVQAAIDELTTDRGYNVTTKTNNYLIQEDDDIIIVNASGNTVTITLPNANIIFSKLISPKKKVFTIKAIDITNSVTVESNGGTIDGEVNFVFQTQFDSITFVPDGNNWFII